MLSSNFSYDKEVLETVYSFTFEKTIKKVYNLHPKVGYFILNRLCVGVSMPYIIEVNKSESSVLTDEIIGVGPFVKYYQPLATNFYGVFGAGFSWNKETDQSISHMVGSNAVIQITNVHTRSTLLSLGLSYFASENVAVEFAVTRRTQLTDESTGYPYVYRDWTMMDLGLQYYLRRKTE